MKRYRVHLNIGKKKFVGTTLATSIEEAERKVLAHVKVTKVEEAPAETLEEENDEGLFGHLMNTVFGKGAARTVLVLLLLGTGQAQAQQFYGAASVSAGNGPDLSASYASLELGAVLGSANVGAAVGRDLAATEAPGLYFVELRGTQNVNLFREGPGAYLCGGIGQYLDGRWVNEFGAGLCWPSGFSVGACSFGGFGYLSLGWTGVFGKKQGI